jgi:hypothetical protein
VTWPGRFKHFAVSSGTASAGKIIPVSHEMLVLNRRYSMGAAVQYLAQTGKAGYWFGRLLSVPGRIEEDPRYPGTLVGEVSGLQAEYAPAFVKAFYQAVPNEVLFMDNWERKLDAIVEHTLEMDIRAIAMVPTWALVLFRRLVRAHNAKGGRQVRTVCEIWPNLQVFFSGGVALSSYRGLLEQQIGRRIDFIENYGASEGFFAFQSDPADRDMLLHLDNGVFYEFVPMDDLGAEAPRRHTIADVEPGVRNQHDLATGRRRRADRRRHHRGINTTDPHQIVVARRKSDKKVK